MSHTIIGKMNKAASEFQAGESIGFGINLGVQYYDRKSKQKEWTNYKAVVFAKASAQVDFYRSALVEGSIVAVSAPQQKIDSYEGANGVSLSIELINAQVEYIYTGDQSPKQDKQSQPQLAKQPAPVDDSFDDDIPF